ncbi:hypothetical protein Pfo_031626 [Paulownia fortunei]|nr:hypothetical protein Pfo_031626 [Paulownia fortunei]
MCPLAERCGGGTVSTCRPPSTTRPDRGGSRSRTSRVPPASRSRPCRRWSTTATAWRPLPCSASRRWSSAWATRRPSSRAACGAPVPTSSASWSRVRAVLDRAPARRLGGDHGDGYELLAYADSRPARGSPGGTPLALTPVRNAHRRRHRRDPLRRPVGSVDPRRRDRPAHRAGGPRDRRHRQRRRGPGRRGPPARARAHPHRPRAGRSDLASSQLARPATGTPSPPPASRSTSDSCAPVTTRRSARQPSLTSSSRCPTGRRRCSPRTTRRPSACCTPQRRSGCACPRDLSVVGVRRRPAGVDHDAAAHHRGPAARRTRRERGRDALSPCSAASPRATTCACARRCASEQHGAGARLRRAAAARRLPSVRRAGHIRHTRRCWQPIAPARRTPAACRTRSAVPTGRRTGGARRPDTAPPVRTTSGPHPSPSALLATDRARSTYDRGMSYPLSRPDGSTDGRRATTRHRASRPAVLACCAVARVVRGATVRRGRETESRRCRGAGRAARARGAHDACGTTDGTSRHGFPWRDVLLVMRRAARAPRARGASGTTDGTSRHGFPWRDVLLVVREHVAPAAARCADRCGATRGSALSAAASASGTRRSARRRTPRTARGARSPTGARSPRARGRAARAQVGQRGDVEDPPEGLLDGPHAQPRDLGQVDDRHRFGGVRVDVLHGGPEPGVPRLRPARRAGRRSAAEHVEEDLGSGDLRVLPRVRVRSADAQRPRQRRQGALPAVLDRLVGTASRVEPHRPVRDVRPRRGDTSDELAVEVHSRWS